MINFKSEQINELAVALAKAQSQLKPVIKNKESHVHKYADLTACMEAITESFAPQGLSISQLLDIDQNSGKIVLLTILLHTSGQWIKSVFPVEAVSGKMSAIQQFGTGFSYAKRYALCAIAGIVPEDEDDENKLSEQFKGNATNNLTQQFLSLCKTHKVDPRLFANKHKINAQDPETIAFAIQNFEELLQKNNSRELVA